MCTCCLQSGGTFIQSEELLEGDSHDDLLMCQEIDFVSPVEEPVLRSHFDNQDMNDEQQMQKNLHFNNKAHSCQAKPKPHVESCDVEGKHNYFLCLIHTVPLPAGVTMLLLL